MSALKLKCTNCSEDHIGNYRWFKYYPKNFQIRKVDQEKRNINSKSTPETKISKIDPKVSFADKASNKPADMKSKSGFKIDTNATKNAKSILMLHY